MEEDSDSPRLSQLKAFDDTKAGVKGLVDAGVATVPPIFRHPPDPHDASASATTTIPVVDLGRPDLGLLRAAAETVGFFQVVNHGVPAELLAETLAAVRRFNEEPAEARRPYYTRDPARRVRYHSNFDLFQSPAANWRDTLFLEMPAPPEEMPPQCRAAVPEYVRQLRRLGARLLELLSEALGLGGAHLREMGCAQSANAVGHYYPPCPEPHRTLGTSRHTDPAFLTVLLQDGMGGLQVLLDRGGGAGRGWVDVPPLPGALIVNIGDLLQARMHDQLSCLVYQSIWL